jgi:hypothetical protein
MFRKLILLDYKLLFLILICNIFLRGQGLNFTTNNPYQFCWESTEKTAAKIASDNDSKIFIPLTTGVIMTIDTNNNKIWVADIGGEIVSQPVYQDKIIYVLSKLKKTPKNAKEADDAAEDIIYSISALDKDSGISKWKKEFKSIQIPALFPQKGRLLVVLVRKAAGLNEYISNFNVLDGQTGSTVFEKDFDFEVKKFFNTTNENSQHIVISTSSNSIISFSVLDGTISFSGTSVNGIQTGTVFNNGILFSNERGNIYFVDPAGKENEFKIRFGARVNNIIYHMDSILISSLDNFVYSVSLDGKKINWKRRFAGRIVERPVINQNVAIAYSQGDNSLYFLNYEDGKVLNRITLTGQEEVIGEPLLLTNLVIVTTSNGIKAFGTDNCKNLKAAER